MLLALLFLLPVSRGSARAFRRRVIKNEKGEDKDVRSACSRCITGTVGRNQNPFHKKKLQLIWSFPVRCQWMSRVHFLRVFSWKSLGLLGRVIVKEYTFRFCVELWISLQLAFGQFWVNTVPINDPAFNYAEFFFVIRTNLFCWTVAFCLSWMFSN